MKVLGFGSPHMSVRVPWLVPILLSSCSFLAAQHCPDRPESGNIVNDPDSISSQNGILSAKFTLAHSVDKIGYTHYCYKYDASGQIVEAPTSRRNPGDTK